MYGYIETHVVEHVQVFGAYWCHRLQSNTITIAPIWRKRRSGRKFYNFRLNDSVVVYCCRCMYVCTYSLPGRQATTVESTACATWLASNVNNIYKTKVYIHLRMSKIPYAKTTKLIFITYFCMEIIFLFLELTIPVWSCISRLKFSPSLHLEEIRGRTKIAQKIVLND